jgi:hypothetical protein
MPDRALLLLADIGGYTKFMRLHRLNLGHSQEITQRLLESMLDAVPTLKLEEVEGDALFLSVPQDEPRTADTASDWVPSALAMYHAFHAKQQWLVAHNLCACDACRQAGKLRVKFVAHLGDVATQRIRDTEKLVGVDVIAVHRMLKSTVPVGEYVLMSEALYRQLDPKLRERTVLVEQELEGLGRVPLYFFALDEQPTEAPIAPDPTLAARIWGTIGFCMRALPRVISPRDGS